MIGLFIVPSMFYVIALKAQSSSCVFICVHTTYLVLCTPQVTMCTSLNAECCGAHDNYTYMCYIILAHTCYKLLYNTTLETYITLQITGTGIVCR